MNVMFELYEGKKLEYVIEMKDQEYIPPIGEKINITWGERTFAGKVKAIIASYHEFAILSVVKVKIKMKPLPPPF